MKDAFLGDRFAGIGKLALMVFLLLTSNPSSRAEASQHAGSQGDVPIFCVRDHCATTDHMNIGGLVVGAAGVGAGATAYIYGPEAAIAAAGGFLLFGHFLFDVVPLGIAGAVAYVYGPEAWEWFGMEPDGVGTDTAN